MHYGYAAAVLADDKNIIYMQDKFLRPLSILIEYN